MHPEASLEGIKKGLQGFINNVVKRLRINAQDFDKWAATIADAMEAKFVSTWNQPYSEKNTFLSKNGEAELQKIRSIMAICPVEKSSQDFGLCCQKLHLHELWHEIQSSHYEEVHMLDDDTIWNKHAELSKKNHTHVVDSNRFTFSSIKMHKIKTGFCWISGSHMTVVN